jgi:hypothetical protein
MKNAMITGQQVLHQDLRPIAILYRRNFTYFSNHLFLIFRKGETLLKLFLRQAQTPTMAIQPATEAFTPDTMGDPVPSLDAG